MKWLRPEPRSLACKEPSARRLRSLKCRSELPYATVVDRSAPFLMARQWHDDLASSLATVRVCPCRSVLSQRLMTWWRGVLAKGHRSRL